MKLNHILKFLIVYVLTQTSILHAQEKTSKKIDIENYFSYEILTSSYRKDKTGNFEKFLYPKVLEPFDETSNYINTHFYRFLYLMRNQVSWDSLISYYPDTIKITSEVFRAYQKPKFLLPTQKFLAPESSTLTYTEEELISIGSRFFLLESNYSAHVCVSINGLQNLNTEKDYTLLEAVVYEAIFTATIQEENQPKFYSKFRNYLSELYEEEILEKITLEEARNLLFTKMKNDDDLKTYLLKFHEVNKESIPYRIL